MKEKDGSYIVWYYPENNIVSLAEMKDGKLEYTFLNRDIEPNETFMNMGTVSSCKRSLVESCEILEIHIVK